MSTSILRGKDGFDTSLVPRFSNFAHFQHREASGTVGGAAIGGEHNLRPLNHVEYNSIAGASLSSNTITLPAGIYYVDFWSEAFAVVRHKALLQDQATAIYTIIGKSAYAGNSGNGSSNASYGQGIIDLSSVTNLQIKHFVQISRTNALGQYVGSGESEIYAGIKIWKIEDAV